MKEKLELIIDRGSTLEEELRHPLPSKESASLCRPHSLTTTEKGATPSVDPYHNHGVSEPEYLPSRPLRYSSLSELLHLVELEHRHRMLRIEVQLLKFCTEVVLPKYKDEK